MVNIRIGWFSVKQHRDGVADHFEICQFMERGFRVSKLTGYPQEHATSLFPLLGTDRSPTLMLRFLSLQLDHPQKAVQVILS